MTYAYALGVGQMKIVALDLSKPTDVEQLMFMQNSFFRSMSKSYGERYLGDEIIKKRILKEKHLVLFLHDESATLELLGACTVRPDGKRGALFVLPQYRRRSIASVLLKESLKYLSFQFTELDPHKPEILALFSKCGFHRINSELEIRKLLGEDSILISNLWNENGNTVYCRPSKHHNKSNNRLRCVYAYTS